MKRAWGISLLIAAWLALLGAGGLALAAPSHANAKPHLPRCRAGYVRRSVRVALRRHGRIVRRHHKVVYHRVSRCVKVTKRPPRCRAGYVRRWVRVAVRRHGRIVRRHHKVVYHRVSRCVKAPKPPPPPPAPPPPPPPPPPPAPDPVVVAVGDIACPAGDTNPADNCEQALTAKVASAQNPTAVLPLGDNQYESGLFSEYTGAGAYNATWGGFNPIVHPVPGNHEYEMSSSAAGYFQYFGGNGVMTGPPGGYYSFNLGAWHIIALNSNCSDSGCADSVNGATTAAQVSWLQSDLAANRSACTLAYWHHPLFSAGDIGDSPGVAPLWTSLYNAHADVVLGGHDHDYERYAQQDPSRNATTSGIREFVVGTGGENLVPFVHPKINVEASDNQDFGVLALTLHAGSYDWKYVTTSGAVIDSGTTACHGPAGAATASAARDIATANVAGLERREPQLVFDARPLRFSLTAAVRTGVPVAIHCSLGCDVTVTASLRRGRRLRRIATFYETESQLPEPYSQISLRLPETRLGGLSEATLVLRFAAIDAANHHRVVKRVVVLKR